MRKPRNGEQRGLDGAPQLKSLMPKMRVTLVSAQYDQSRMIQELSQKASIEAFVPKDDLELEVAKNELENQTLIPIHTYRRHS
jgi:hypothetical protein